MQKTIFLTSKSLYDYVVMLSGLCNALATFQGLMNLKFAYFINEFVTRYLDIYWYILKLNNNT